MDDQNTFNSADGLQKIIDLVPNQIFVKDSAHRWVLVNQALAELLGKPKQMMLGKSDFDFLPHEEAAIFWARDDEVLRTGLPSEHEETITDAKGRLRTVVTRKCVIEVGPEKGSQHIVGVISDITRYRESEALYRMLADHGTDLVFHTDSQFRRRYVSPSVRDMLGYAPEEFFRLEPGDIIHPDEFTAVMDAYRHMQAMERTAAVRYRYRHKNGTYIWVEGIGRRLADGNGFVITIRDLTHRLQIEQRLEEANRRLEILAMQDGLTGLANRRHFDERLEAEVNHALCVMMPVSLILIDVDHFKRLNDTYGHLSGDDCLRDIAQTVRQAIQRPADLAARYGGEEIAVLLPSTDAKGALLIAERIRSAVQALKREHTSAPTGFMTISLGVATLDPHLLIGFGQPRDLIAAADRALYAAKTAGRDRVIAAEVPALAAPRALTREAG